MDLQLAGKTVLITGASQGIGAGLARAFAQEQCSLVLVARSEDKLQSLAQEIARQYKVDAQIIAVDLTAPGVIDKVLEQGSHADILINNAGAIPGGNLWDVDAPKWREGWELKVMCYIDMCRAFYRHMRERGHGVILNNIGNGGEMYDFDYIAGTAGNAALMAFTRALGGRSLQHGIRVLGVNPGPVATERIERILRARAQTTFGDPEQYGQLLKKLPLGRAAHVEEVADLFVFLASPRSAYTSGAIFTVDGGITSNKALA
ncbi:SDR family oxidoreductase [Pusillimonas sp. ANT_WB101]|uniref:SDR family oxidoreductase n=1 Tax=Pusillimonas sp. ANT_WB101 TaxID=2597356 RepID=UPI0011EDAA72|nr:SDR family oxidoreductase [Pusillimonas sp. ANT_WB101]KAA0892814.1 SDR family oxidoreductase [Pusillimonas sp. ANT_WB101]